MKTHNNQITQDLKLLENGLCFIREAVDRLKQCDDAKDQNTELKYIILHLFPGISLIFKERLKEEHWSLLFSNVNEANEKSLRSGDFKGVNFEDCKNRLSEISSINFTNKQEETLSSLKKQRNKIEHFFEQHSLESFKSIVASGLDIALYFIENHLKSNLSENDKKNIEHIKQECFTLKDFVKERMKTLKANLDKQDVILHCGQCDNETIVPNKDGEGMECLFCKREVSENEYLDFYYNSLGCYSPEDMLFTGAILCGKCDNENCLVTSLDKKRYFCLYCQTFTDIESFDTCTSCGVDSANCNNSSTCGSCWNDYIESDHT